MIGSTESLLAYKAKSATILYELASVVFTALPTAAMFAVLTLEFPTNASIFNVFRNSILFLTELTISILTCIIYRNVNKLRQDEYCLLSSTLNIIKKLCIITNMLLTIAILGIIYILIFPGVLTSAYYYAVLACSGVAYIAVFFINLRRYLLSV